MAKKQAVDFAAAIQAVRDATADEEPGSTFHTYQANVACLLRDRHGIVNLHQANAMALDIVRLCFGGWERVDAKRAAADGV